MRRIPTVAALVALLLPYISATAQTDMKVQVFAGTLPISAAIVADRGELQLFADLSHEPLAAVRTDTVFVSRGAVDLQTRAGELRINLTDLYAVAPRTGSLLVEVTRPDRTTASRRFTGRIHIANDAGSGQLRLINEVDMETYVAAVVGKEYDLDAGEGARAMAIVARTFGARAARDGDGVATDGLAAQVYRGVDAITDASRSAAESTRGKILTYEGAPIVAVYSASNGGHSASNADVWSGEPLPYLRARKDRYDREASPHKDWVLSSPADEIHRLIAAKLGAEVTSVSVSKRTRDGRVRSVVAKTPGGSEEISGNDFRTILSREYGATSLRSTKFEMDRKGDNYEFKGAGFGHGVGLSQWGTFEMSRRGYNHEEILRYYYPGASLGTMDDVDLSPIPAFASKLRPAGSLPETHENELATVMTTNSRLVGWTQSMSEPSSRDRAGRRRLGW